MSHLIIVAHPLIDSVTMKLARAYALELKQLGRQPVIHDLYRMGFNPVLSAAELEPLSHGREPLGEIVHAQAAVASADALTVIYPLWWATMPGILKGYIDRVFARGFAYEGGEGETRGLLSGKQCVLITLSGSPMAMLRETGDWGAIDQLQDSHIFRSCGFELLEHLHMGVSGAAHYPSHAGGFRGTGACLRPQAFPRLRRAILWRNVDGKIR
jgi:NAD(P)H dehydrogenase (quinone)